MNVYERSEESEEGRKTDSGLEYGLRWMSVESVPLNNEHSEKL